MTSDLSFVVETRALLTLDFACLNSTYESSRASFAFVVVDMAQNLLNVTGTDMVIEERMMKIENRIFVVLVLYCMFNKFIHCKYKWLICKLY